MIEQTKLFEDIPKSEKKKEFKILHYIGNGKNEAVSMSFLSHITNTDKRAIRSMVHEARLSGHIIIGDDNGYYKPSCEEELEAWIHSQEAYIKSKSRALKSARKALRNRVYERSDREREI